MTTVMDRLFTALKCENDSFHVPESVKLQDRVAGFCNLCLRNMLKIQVVMSAFLFVPVVTGFGDDAGM